MHGERDLLTRFVFPELRALGRQHFINVFEVDLRWGVTEEATSTNRWVLISLCYLYVLYAFCCWNADVCQQVQQHSQVCIVVRTEYSVFAFVSFLGIFCSQTAVFHLHVCSLTTEWSGVMEPWRCFAQNLNTDVTSNREGNVMFFIQVFCSLSLYLETVWFQNSLCASCAWKLNHIFLPCL